MTKTAESLHHLLPYSGQSGRFGRRAPAEQIHRRSAGTARRAADQSVFAIGGTRNHPGGRRSGFDRSPPPDGTNEGAGERKQYLHVGGVHLEETIKGGMPSLRHALEAWGEIERRMRRAGQVVLFADFDGTLVRIERTPAAVQLAPRARGLLSRLARSGVLVGVASGRRLSDIRRRVGLRRIFYVGSHGYSCYRPGQGVGFALNSQQLSLMAAVRRALRRRLRGLTGIWLEPKDGPVAVHYRNASRSNAAAAEEAMRQMLSEHPGLRLLAGKKAWELLPDGRVSKWTAMKQILRAARLRRPSQLFYLGDDATDERVFSEMSGISVAIGRRRRTAARYYLRSSGEVLTFLERILETVK